MYNVLDKVQGGRRSTNHEDPARVLSKSGRKRARARLAEVFAGSRAARDRPGLAASPMALASGHAAMPFNGRGIVGNPDRPAHEAHSASSDLLVRDAPGRIAWIYQESSRPRRTMIWLWRGTENGSWNSEQEESGIGHRRFSERRRHL